MTDDPSLEVTYTGSTATEIEYWHNIYGLMKFHIRGRTAVQNPDWDRLSDQGLADGYSRGITTGDVLRAVLSLPFIDDVAHPDANDPDQ